MKTRNLLLLVLLSAMIFQCSENSSETDGISVLPGDSENTSDDGTIAIVGYANESNARLIVKSVDRVEVAPEYGYIADWILGLEEPNNPGTIVPSNTTEVFFDFNTDSLRVRTPEYAKFSLLSVSDDLSTLYLPQWKLKFSLTYCQDCDPGFAFPDIITISGVGKGSHIFDLYYNNFEAYKATEVTFEFNGAPMPYGDVDSSIGITYDGYDAEGSFSIIEKSADSKYNLAIYGTMTIDFD